MARRLILVSNRVAVPDSEGPRRAGGLTVAIHAAQKLRDNVWFGWSGEVCEGDTPPPPVTVVRSRRKFVLQDLPATDYQEYYNGFANRVLWPIFHYRVDLAEFNTVELGGYLRVNRLFANSLAGLLQPDDLVWVHDYHLLTVARKLRALGFEMPLGFFLHIPCPPPDILLTMPQHAETLGALTNYDLVGVQTERDAVNLGDYFEQSLGAVRKGGGVFERDGRRVQVRAFPVSIATGVYARAARASARAPNTVELKDSLGGKKLIIGVDRLDYTKGIPQRIQAFGHFMDRYPEWHEKVTFLQITPKSRTEVQEYADLEHEVSALVGQINGAHAAPAWTPIRYLNRSFSRGSLAGMYRTADVGLVTPLRDGMNLVAKEFVAAQDPENPGVLILSQFAGASEGMPGALIVNPHEPDAVADAIRTALNMPLEERLARWRPMFANLQEHDINRWAEDFLSGLLDTRQSGGFRDSIWRLLSGSAAAALTAWISTPK